MAAILTLAGCKNDSFEKQNSEASADSNPNIENLTSIRYNFGQDTNSDEIKYMDAITYKVGNNEKRLTLDSDGNVVAEYTYKNDGEKCTGYEIIRHKSNGISPSDAHHVVCNNINDSTSVTNLFDANGDLISGDSTIFRSPKSAVHHIIPGTSELWN